MSILVDRDNIYLLNAFNYPETKIHLILGYTLFSYVFSVKS